MGALPAQRGSLIISGLASAVQYLPNLTTAFSLTAGFLFDTTKRAQQIKTPPTFVCFLSALTVLVLSSRNSSNGSLQYLLRIGEGLMRRSPSHFLNQSPLMRQKTVF